MQIRRIGYGVRGLGRVADYAVRWSRMVTEEAQRRARVLAFWKGYGLEATRAAFAVGRSTLFGWQKARRGGGGSLESLNPRSRKPKRVRQRQWPEGVRGEIRRLRHEHPNLGKGKIHPLLERFCGERGLRCPSIPTIGNLIRDMGGLRTFPAKVRHDGTIVQRGRERVPRKPKGFVATHPGHCVALDTVERFIHGARRYLITFTDTFSRFSFAHLTTSHASLAAKEFFDAIRVVFPYQIGYVLTDNGSEFKKRFADELRRLCLTHWHTYPRTPKMNAHDERFNRTVQEEFVDYHASLMLDPGRFNQQLMDWLVWYNCERPHYAFQNKLSPLQFLLNLPPDESRMHLTHTPA
jgi:transposase InsO family protein